LEDTRRILIACVGNVLRGDDGFGYAVATRLVDLPAGVEVLETGIGGVALLQELMHGCDGLIVVDAVDRHAEPGTLFIIEPDVGEPSSGPDMHLANPDRVLAMAKVMGCLPERLLIVGCQPGDVEELREQLTAPVQRAVGEAVQQVSLILDRWRSPSRVPPAV